MAGKIIPVVGRTHDLTHVIHNADPQYCDQGEVNTLGECRNTSENTWDYGKKHLYGENKKQLNQDFLEPFSPQDQ
jgi:hypothetical protein